MKKGMKILTLILCLFLFCGNAYAQTKELTISGTKMTGSTNGYIELGQTVELSATTNYSSRDSTFKFSYQYAGEMTLIRDYESTSKVNWTPDRSGQYSVIYEVQTTDGQYKKAVSSLNVINPSKVAISNIDIDKASPQTEGETINITVTATGGTEPYEYRYVFTDLAKEKYSEDSLYQENNTYSWETLGAGNYKLTVYVRDKGGQIESEDISYVITENTENAEKTQKKQIIALIAVGVIFVLVVVGSIVLIRLLLKKFKTKQISKEKKSCRKK